MCFAVDRPTCSSFATFRGEKDAQLMFPSLHLAAPSGCYFQEAQESQNSMLQSRARFNLGVSHNKGLYEKVCTNSDTHPGMHNILSKALSALQDSNYSLALCRAGCAPLGAEWLGVVHREDNENGRC